MPKIDTKPIKQQILELQIKIACLGDEIKAQEIYELMPQRGPHAEHYSYGLACMKLGNIAVENWLRAVVMHLNERIANPINIEIVEIPKSVFTKQSKIKLLNFLAAKWGVDVNITEKKAAVKSTPKKTK